MRVLVTGSGGFVGGHLCRYLIENTDWEIVGTVYPELDKPSLQHTRLQYRHVDLRDPEGVSDLVEQVVPESVFHLAAQSSVSSSYSDPWTTLESNVRGQLNLLESVRRSGRAVRFLVIGSNEEYGAPKPSELPQTETNPLRPQSPYAVSKVAQDMMGLQYNLAHGMEVVGVHMKTSLPTCQKRNGRRTEDRKIPKEKVEEMYAALEPPDFSEGFDRIEEAK